LESNIVQFFNPRELDELRRRFEVADGDVLIMIADPSYTMVTSALGQLRLHLARRLELIPAGMFHPVWVTDFPLFEATDQGGVTSSHHPFTAPDRTDFDPRNVEELLTLRSRAYDLVVNGEELGGGSIRINNRDVQRKVFTALGLSEDEIQERFGFFLRALDFGAPPHGGLALGMDRTVSMILQTPSIREVIAFPKNRSAACPLTRAPSVVKSEQLAELGLLNLGGAEVLRGTEEREDRIDHLSWVSRIGVNDDERPLLEEVLAEAEALAALAAQQAGTEEPLFTVVPTANRMRPGREERRSVLSEQGRLRDSSPSVKGDYYKVASVLE
jgi:aspartyl-tRNA synthetase